MLASLAIGRAVGKLAIRRYGAAGAPRIGSLESAVFALLGLLIAFTFSGALSRFDARRVQVVEEANAIGTAYLRIDLLPASAQPALRQAFRDYLDSRLATYRRIGDIEAARAELARSENLQGKIWKRAVAATRLPDARPSAEILVMPALNQMFDVTTVRVVATQMHPPQIIYWMLVALAVASGLLAGYQSAGRKATTGSTSSASPRGVSPVLLADNPGRGK